VGKASRSLLGSFLGGEGLVCKFSGRGRLFCQSHNPVSFGRLLGPLLKPRSA
ncbi:MAG: AIM24 family protein, partial [Planctomycetota bacterium]